MRFYVINNRESDETVSILFHDPSTSYYFIKSKSEVFRRSFEAASKSTDLVFKKEKSALTYSLLDSSKPFWAKQALDKACGSNWYIYITDDIDLTTQVSDIVDKYLKL